MELKDLSRDMSVREQYDGWSESYDRTFVGDYSYIAPRETFNRVSAHTDVDRPALQLLDVGIGTGLLSEQFRRTNRDAFITGIDISPGMLQECHRKRIANRLIERSLATRLPFPDAQFDIAASTGVFELLRHPKNIIAEMARVTCPGGVIAFTSPRSWFDSPNTIGKFLPPTPMQLLNWIDRGSSKRAKHFERAMNDNGLELIEKTAFNGYRKHGAYAPYQLYIGRKRG